MTKDLEPEAASSVQLLLKGVQDVVCESAAMANAVAASTIALQAHCSIGTVGGVVLTAPLLFTTPPHISLPSVAAGGMTGCMVGVGYGYRSGNIQEAGKEIYRNSRKTCMSR